MAGLNVNLNQMAGTAQKTDTIGNDMLMRTQSLLNGIREIRERFTGFMGTAVNNALNNAEPRLIRMIDLLQPLASDTKQAAQVLSSQDQSGQTKVQATFDGIGVINRPV